MKTFKLSISTPIGKNYETESAVMINANVLEGRIGVLANRSPLISSLKVSDFTIELEDGSKLTGITSGGIFNVTKDGVTMLTTRFDFSHEINIEKAKEELADIEKEFQKDVKDAAQNSLNRRHIYAELQVKIAGIK